MQERGFDYSEVAWWMEKKLISKEESEQPTQSLNHVEEGETVVDQEG